MKDFRLFDVSDFLMDEDFIRWVRLKEKEDNIFWDDWVTQHPDKYMVIVEAKSILESFVGHEKEISNEEREVEIQRLLNTVNDQSAQEARAVIRQVHRFRKRWYVAAAILVLIATGAGYMMFGEKSKHIRYDYASITPSKRLLESVNTSDRSVTLTLPDESTVKLAPNSRIAYANNFDSGATRDVYISGEAFFTVTKNPARPFRVFANEIVTKVLGTSFSVRSFGEDSIIQVIVKTGKVSVYSQASVNETVTPYHLGGIILSPNQELVYQKSKQKFQKILLQNPHMIVPEIADKNLLYEDVSLITVFEQLGKNYGISIVYDNELIKNCTITADLRTVAFYEKLELICKAIGARYEVIDGQVVILTTGCVE